MEVALRHDRDPFTLASWIFKPLPAGRRLKVPGIRRWSLSDAIEMQSPDYQFPPVMGESAWSFVSRIAAANGYVGAESVRRFVIHYFKWQRGDSQSLAYKWLFLAPRFSAEVAKWLDGREAVPWSADRWRGKRPFCPECIRREVVFMESWEREGALTCEEHGAWLQTRCAQCGDELSWVAGSIDACRCGGEFRKGHVSRDVAEQPAEKRDSRLQAEPLGSSNLTALDAAVTLLPRASGSAGGHFGWCTCRQVSIELGGAPVAMGLCHCSDCRAITGGGGLAFMEYETGCVSVRGATMRYSLGSSGVRLGCRFCSQPVLTSRFDSRVCRVHASLLGEESILFQPQFEQWVERRAAWITALAVPQFARQRPAI